jgi:hypothetical protein
MYIGAGTKDQQGPIVQQMNQWAKKEGRKVIWQRIPMHRIYPICFYLNRLESGKGGSSSEAQLQSSKTSRGSYFDPELYIFLSKYLNYISRPSPCKLLPQEFGA